MHKTYFNWSSGKDSMLALHYLKEQNITIDLLLTTVNGHYNRVSMHGLPINVLEAQARALELSLNLLVVPENPSMEDYNELMNNKLHQLKSAGYDQTVFGDIFLEDLKQYREQMLKPLEIAPLFPLWLKDTKVLIKEFIDLGYKAVIVCANLNKLDESFLGQTITHELVKQLPSDVDPCGENGEFHTFCYDGPLFNHPIPFSIGEKVIREYPNPSSKEATISFGFCDIVLNN